MNETSASTQKTLIHQFSSEIFPRNLWVVRQPPKGWLKKHFKTINNKNLREHTPDEAKAVTYSEVYNIDSKSYGILVVILASDMSISDCAHEATHYAMCLYAAIGEDISLKHQEVFAHLVGYGTDCIYQVVKDEYRPMFNGSNEL